ncbi:transglycosylase SLT domain-containing protein [Cronobacter sp. EKM101R]|uniref:transglycosylase SLT domain-containing protein n=1 Tax=Cronobacter TaxID=413496 RepID=UPI0013EBB1DF|nr:MULTISPECIES: transglycosylase SLT domain-containing protein [Cronobacter]KAF6596772.1 transglycosylase SLT domain-containing protein [Cronobacter sp. EKM101R]KAF6599598.1 transglycosylase SLT domain-containing protein [Cronobacter sp. EKM102R]MDK1185166.1 transglycosylase SLT domain-containing protein [Cronobacter turicensis]MDK1195297.1 transglycosylase SLT domain-containing protein [Cronobacter dublinensis]MDK1200440.1 transglycosylase SLT domain-containing protein [Cronobacter dublinens
MIINELAYKVTIKADEFLNGKRKVKDEVSKLNRELARAEKERERELEKQRREMEKFAKTATTSFRNVYTAAAGFLGIGAGLYGIKQLFTSTANEIVRASQQAKFFGSDVNKMFGVQRGFKQAGLNADPFIAASGNARMALANIADPTVMGGLTGASQNLLTLGARTGLNINNLGDPSKALAEFTRYSKTHSQENLMQVMASAGFDPSDAAKIKSGELKRLVDSETKKSNITAQQVKEQENVVATLGELDAELSRLKQDLAMAFSQDAIDGMKAFSKWISENHGKIEDFFENAGDKVKAFTEAVGGAENALKILAAAYVGSRATGGIVPPWLAGLIAYGTYLYNDRENIDVSAHGSWDYLKRNLGDAARYIGIDTDLGRKSGTVFGHNIQPDIPGGAEGVKSVDDEALLDAIRKVESADGKYLYSPKGAVGPYQFMEDTAIELGLRVDDQVDERLDEQKARAAAKKYLHRLLKHYKGNVNHALMAYNWGIGKVDHYLTYISPTGFNSPSSKYWSTLPKETREYTQKIRTLLGVKDDDTMAYYQYQQALADKPAGMASNVNNSQSNSTHIGTVVVQSNPQSVDALTQSVNDQVRRATTNQAFSSGVR